MSKRHKLLERLNLVYFLLNCTQELNILTFIYYHYYHNLNSLYNNFKSIRLYILFSNFKKERKEVKSLSRARLFATPWIVACTKLLCPWDFQGKSTAVGCHFLLRGIFPTQGSNQVSHIVDRRFTVWATLGTLKSYKKLRSCPQSTKPISVVGLYHHFSKLLRWGFDNRRQI